MSLAKRGVCFCSRILTADVSGLAFHCPSFMPQRHCYSLMPHALTNEMSSFSYVLKLFKLYMCLGFFKYSHSVPSANLRKSLLVP